MNFNKNLQKIPYFSKISSFAKKNKIKIWLVGGVLRDFYLGKTKELIDFDFCVEKNTYSTAKKISLMLQGKLIVLDKTTQSYRVILKKQGKVYTYDFTQMRGKDLKEDVSLRDFTINMLALPLHEKKLEIIDHFSAKNDFRKKQLRCVKDCVFSDDPLRILRAFSFSANLGFSIETNTQKAICKYKKYLKRVSGERISEEFFKLLKYEKSFLFVKKMSELEILDCFIPHIAKCRGVKQGGFHHLDVWQHSLETLRQFEHLFNRKLAEQIDLLKYLNEAVSGNRKKYQVIKLACLLHDIGKPKAKRLKKKKTIFYEHERIGKKLVQEVSDRFKLSFPETTMLKKLVFWHLRPGYLADQIKPSKRAIYHFFRDTENEGIAVILLSLADWRATRGPLTSVYAQRRHEKIMLGLLDWYFQDKKKKPVVRLVDGYDLMRKFKLNPSPLVGEILKAVKEEQALGHIKTKLEAYELAKKIIRCTNS